MLKEKKRKIRVVLYANDGEEVERKRSTEEIASHTEMREKGEAERRRKRKKRDK